MVYWRLGEKEEARKWFDEAAAWMAEHAPTDQKLRHLRAEAGKLFGLPDSAATR